MSERIYFTAEDGATYWIVANSAKHALELLIGHGFMDALEPGEGASIALIDEDKAAKVMVYLDERDKEKTPLTAASVGDVFSTEF
jgi:hypothetical protein